MEEKRTIRKRRRSRPQTTDTGPVWDNFKFWFRGLFRRRRSYPPPNNGAAGDSQP